MHVGDRRLLEAKRATLRRRALPLQKTRRADCAYHRCNHGESSDRSTDVAWEWPSHVSGLQSAIAADYTVYFWAQIDLKITNGETDNDHV